MDLKISNDFSFGFVTFKELISEGEGWALKEARKRCNLEALMTCPDIIDDFPVFFYVADDNKKKIASSYKIFPDLVFFNNQKYLWAWAGDALTDERYRKLGLAKLMFKDSVKVLYDKSIGWGGVFSNEIILSLYRKLGACLPGYATRYIMIKSVRPVVEAYIPPSFFRNMLVKTSQVPLNLISSMSLISFEARKYSIKKLEINDLKNYKVFFDNLMSKNTAHFNCSIDKILWKLNISQANNKNYTTFYCVHKKEEPVAYFVIRSKFQEGPMGNKFKNFKLMTLMDFDVSVPSKSLFQIILHGVVRQFLKSDCEVLEIISNSAQFNKLTKKPFFWRGGKGMSFTFFIPNNWTVPPGLEDINSWHLTHFAGDGFSF